MNFTRTLTVLAWVRLKSHTIRGFMYCPNVSDGGVTTNSSARLVTGGEHHQHPSRGTTAGENKRVGPTTERHRKHDQVFQQRRV